MEITLHLKLLLSGTTNHRSFGLGSYTVNVKVPELQAATINPQTLAENIVRASTTALLGNPGGLATACQTLSAFAVTKDKQIPMFDAEDIEGEAAS